MKTIASVLISVFAAGILLLWPNAQAADAGDAALKENREKIVLLHGLGRNKAAMWRMDWRLEEAGYEVVSLGYESLEDTPEQILADIKKQIDDCCMGKSSKLHFVGHSLGGLLIRAYLSENKVPNLGRVVLVGTPNKGTAILDNLRRKWWFRVVKDVLGPTGQALGTDSGSFPNSLAAPTYPVGIIAGLKNGRNNEKWLPGEDDGLVTVESTKLEGMQDFVVIETGHSAMRYNADVAEQVVNFLRQGKFTKP